MALVARLNRPERRFLLRLSLPPVSTPPVLRLVAFRDLWLGQAISQLGDAFFFVAFMFMVKKVTGRDEMVGLVGALETIPYLLLGSYAGVLADRLDRKRIMLVSDIVCGLALVGFGAVIMVGGTPPIWALLVIPFLLSSVRCFFMPAKSAAIPTLVPANYLQQANAISMATANLMPMISLAISAAVLSYLYQFSPTLFYASTVLLNAASFFGSAYYINRLPAIMPEREKVEGQHPNVMADMKEGFRYLGTRHDMIVLTVMLAVFRLMVAPFFVVYLAANDKWFGGKPATITWFEFSFFVGMVAATAIAGKVKVKHPTQWFCFGLGMVGVTVGLMGISPHFWLFVLLNALAGLAIPFADVPIITYIQASVPNSYQGRVNSVRDMVATGVMPIGMGMAGILVQKAGLVAAFAVMGIGMSMACVVGLADRKFRNVVMPELIAETVTEPEPAEAELAMSR